MITYDLPLDAVEATVSDLFTEGEIPVLKMGITYYESRGGIYGKFVTADHTPINYLISTIGLGKIFVIKQNP